MTDSRELLSPEEMRAAKRAFRKSMSATALWHYDQIGPRTLRVLQILDLMDESADPFPEAIDVAILKDPSHPRRIPLCEGPLLIYKTEEELSATFVELPTLLLSGSVGIREAAVEILQTLRITPRTSAILEANGASLRSSDVSDWMPAGVAMFDGLNDDVLVALQGVCQCINSSLPLQESLNSYVSRVLNPTVSSLESMKMATKNPEVEHDELTTIIKGLVSEATSLAGACQAYHETLGFLPLAPQFGLSEVVQRWMDLHPNEDAWTQVWDWAKDAPGPIPHYHACCVFVLLPDLVPDRELPVLWKEVLNALDESDKDEADENKKEAFALRRDLVRHYMCHLEAHLPGTDSANIACFAWWFAEQLAVALPDELESVRFYQENWIGRALDVSNHIWLTASPHTRGSFLRYVTFAVHSPWALSLLSAMGPKLEELEPEKQSDAAREQFQGALVHHLLSSMPFSVEEQSAPTYALESPLSKLVLKWAKYLPKEPRESLEELAAACEELQPAESLCTALRGIGGSPLASQVVVARALKIRALRDPAALDAVWDIVSDRQWRLDVLGSVEDRVLGLLVEAFITLLVANRGKWCWELPQFLAELCERTDDGERQRCFFVYVLYTSLASDTVGAVRRLLHGERKAQFVSLVAEHRELFEAMRSTCPAWVAGKLRGMMASLRVE